MTDALNNFHFLRPAWLLLAPVAILVWLFWRRRTDALRGWRRQVDPALLKALVVGGGDRTDRSAWWLLAGWLLATVAVAGPTWRLEPSPFTADAQPLVILLKAGQSMDVADPAPSRLERAQLKIADLAAARTGQPLGLVVYAGSAHVVLPPTRDADVVAEMASDIRSDIMPVAGDRLDLAIRKAGEILKAPTAGGTLLVITDSVDADAAALAAAHRDAGARPIQLVPIAGRDAPESASARSAASALRARVVEPTPDDRDVKDVASYADRTAEQGIAGESDRWQEAGYWLCPVVALILAFSFRRVQSSGGEATR